MFTVSEVMSSDLYTLPPEASVLDARALMASSHVRHLPVVSGSGRLVGLITERDLLEAADSSVDGRSDTRHASHEAEISVSDVMSKQLSTVDPRDDLRRAAMYLQQHRYGCLPVTEDGKLVGIITDTDFVTVAINLLEQLEQVGH